MSALADRIKERLLATGLSNAQLAKASKVKQPTAHNWGSGKTKAIKGEPLLAAATALGVNPKWLATGVGPKFPEARPLAEPRYAVRDAVASYDIKLDDVWTREAVMLLTKMSPEDRRAAVLNLRVFSKSLGPPGNGQDISVAA
jgi:transcriptional regulator with XRE-family HTH domain